MHVSYCTTNHVTVGEMEQTLTCWVHVSKATKESYAPTASHVTLGQMLTTSAQSVQIQFRMFGDS